MASGFAWPVVIFVAAIVAKTLNLALLQLSIQKVLPPLLPPEHHGQHYVEVKDKRHDGVEAIVRKYTPRCERYISAQR